MNVGMKVVMGYAMVMRVSFLITAIQAVNLILRIRAKTLAIWYYSLRSSP
jgi:hypothetical protein